MKGLPKHFAEHVLELEMLLQSDCWMHVEAIQELIDLYSVTFINLTTIIVGGRALQRSHRLIFAAA
jgi:hypothetical protein